MDIQQHRQTHIQNKIQHHLLVPKPINNVFTVCVYETASASVHGHCDHRKCVSMLERAYRCKRIVISAVRHHSIKPIHLQEKKRQKLPVTARWPGFRRLQIRVRGRLSEVPHWAAAHIVCPAGAHTERGLEMRGGAGNTNTISARSVSPAANHRPQDKCSYLNVGRN